MPTPTVLDMTQEILSSMSSDEVNSIGDTTESLQVATILKRKYYDIISRASLPEHDQLIQLIPSNIPEMPVLMYVPDEVNKIEWIKYYNTNPAGSSATPDSDYIHDLNVDIQQNGNNDSNTPPNYQYVTILPITQFIDYINGFSIGDANIGSYTFTDDANGFPGNYTFLFQTDSQPRFCTVIGNKYVIFDSYDSTQDDTLQASKSMCWGQIAPTFKMEDDFIPRMDDKQYPLLINEAKALAWFELKQSAHQLANQEIKRQWSSIQKNKSVSNKPSYFDQLPSFGRAGPTATLRDNRAIYNFQWPTRIY